MQNQKSKYHWSYADALPRLIRLEPVRFRKQHPITNILSSTNTMPPTIPTNNMVPDIIPVGGVVNVVGMSPNEEAG